MPIGQQMNAAQARVVDPILTNHARGYTNAEMIGRFLFPTEFMVHVADANPGLGATLVDLEGLAVEQQGLAWPLEAVEDAAQLVEDVSLLRIHLLFDTGKERICQTQITNKQCTAQSVLFKK
jgi:hypothetical protein